MSSYTIAKPIELGPVLEEDAREFFRNEKSCSLKETGRNVQACKENT